MSIEEPLLLGTDAVGVEGAFSVAGGCPLVLVVDVAPDDPISNCVSHDLRGFSIK